MGSVEDAQKMLKEGRTEQEVIFGLEQKGVSAEEIREALSQARIKEAVDTSSQGYGQGEAGDYGPAAAMPEYQEGYSSTEGDYGAYSAPAPGLAPSAEYSAYSSGAVGSDVLQEMAEQAVAEKLSSLKNKIDAALDFRALAETKISYLDERVKRMEKIIDRIEVSVLQKMGEQAGAVGDIRNEIIETQKSFKSLLDRKNQVKT